MRTKLDDQPAFPSGPYYGMSLRQWYIGHALNMSGAFAIAQIIAGKGANLSVDDIAKKAIEIADTIIAEEAKQS
jgi:hypothetical protein